MSLHALRLTAVCVGVVTSLTVFAQPAQTPRTEPPAPELASGYKEKKLAVATRYMVAAAHPLAVDAGLKMLERGGSAIDAAIAVQMVLNLVEPQASGIGGGAFIMHFDAKQKSTVAYNGRETAPMAATPALFLDNDGKPMRFQEAVVGGRSVGVPGLLRVVEMAHARHGKLPWATLFEPAIALAEHGFALSPRVQTHLVNEKILPRDARASAYFYLPDGTAKPVGTILKNPQFAAVLKRIAREGPDAFYTGSLAREMVAAVRGHATNPGTLTEADLLGYRARSGEPLCAPYRSYRICSMPPPGGGLTVLGILQTLERFDLKSVRPGSTEAVHLFAEAGRLAFADRERFLGDERFTPVPMAGLMDTGYIRGRSALIRPEKSMGRAEAGTPETARVSMADGDALEFPSTSHISVVDGDGNAVSMTTTIESFFGSKIFVHGFLLNNQLTDFSMIPSSNGLRVANAVYPGKQPRSAMSPTLVFDADKRLHMVIGSPGGPPIINYVAKALVATLDWGMDIQTAISMPNFGSRNGPTEIEKGTYYENLIGPLKSMGHEVRTIDLTSGLHGIMRTSTGWQGGADPRREGIAKGK
ncbi:MAG: gamma-glutamyltransferase [Burkholderiales bacterium]|nr:gamma-glutamyltransferase [Burkholderiales bacterium]